MIAALSVAGAIAFAPPASLGHASGVRAAASVQMSEAFSRRAMFQTVAAAAAFGAPLAALADGATSAQQLTRSRSIYGSRVARLADASPAAILEEENAFTLFISASTALRLSALEADANSALAYRASSPNMLTGGVSPASPPVLFSLGAPSRSR